MALHEYKKSAKIVEEITEYLLGKGYRKFETSLDFKEKETLIVVTVYTNGVPLAKILEQDLFCCRDVELEEYGWELTGDIHCLCTLDALGLLVDKYEMTETEDKCNITFHRVRNNNKKKSVKRTKKGL